MANMCLDYTTISDFLICRQKYYLRHRLNLVPKQTATALTFGGAWHKAMESVWTEKGKGEETLIKEYGKVEVPLGDKRTLELGKKVLENYLKEKGYNGHEFYPNMEVIGSEVSHCKEFDGVRYCGRMDKVVRWDGSIYVVEHKTASQLGFTFFLQFELNHQIDGYIYLCADKYGECAGVLVDAVLIAKTKFNAMRDTPTRMPGHAERFEAELVDIARNIRWANDNESYPKNKSLCQYYGECPYRDLCLYHGDKRVIEARYKKSVWDAKMGKEVVG